MVSKQAQLHLANSGVLDLCMVTSKTTQVNIASRQQNKATSIQNYGHTGRVLCYNMTGPVAMLSFPYNAGKRGT